MRRMYLALALILLVTASMGCSRTETAQSEWEIIVSSSDGDKIVRIEDLKAMTGVTLAVEVKEEHREYTGVRLSEVLKSVDITAVDEVTLEADDGYTATISGAVALSDNTILAYQVDGQSLNDKSAPVMLVTTEDSTRTWVGQLKKVVIQ